MVDHALREQLTLILMNDALEANSRDWVEATYHLLDVAGTIIIEAANRTGLDDREQVRLAAQYLIGQVDANSGGVQ
ncbi:hypothetical protein SKP52_15770 [Sphingopyxis fribergensis]|uniref:Uncharacterized protein n=1 Tax=Sphingopyxis fribergensis TaxID=1515612 RepID=A0A0A7PIT3_9SPHN|nr:hypothetical protein [Sphingopyxis fribergensis]AJA10031.1 hypothetical protein SKP52_15770 [Sphingopyxis fribergensis]